MRQSGGLRARTALAVVAAAALGAAGSPASGFEVMAASGTSPPASGFDGAAIDEAIEAVLAETTTPGAVVLLRQGGSEYLAAYGTASTAAATQSRSTTTSGSDRTPRR